MQRITDVATKDILASLELSLSRISLADQEAALIAIRKLAAQLETKILNRKGK